MTKPIDEMVAVFGGTGLWADEDEIRAALEAVLAIAERQWQERIAEAFQRGWWRGQHQLCPRCGVELAQEVAEEERHRYLSTGCLHGDHPYCQGETGSVGVKTPAQCKFCSAPCVCPCHQDGAS